MEPGGESSGINYRRVVGAGLLASLALLLGQIAVIAIFGPRLMAARASANLPPVEPRPLWTLLELLLTGFFLVWFYAAIRPRFGPGPATAVRSALAVWAISPLVVTIHMIYDGFGFPPALLLSLAAGLLPAFVLAGVVSAWAYRE